jgi:hypothetical protein
MPTPDQMARIEALRKRKPSVASRMYGSYQESPRWWDPTGPIAKLIDPTVEPDYRAQRDLYYSEGIIPSRDFRGTRYEDEFTKMDWQSQSKKRADELGVPANMRKRYGIPE